jgi:hypothetical protein
MTTFRRLQGLPPYGPMATCFPDDWTHLGREGLVVEFVGTSGTSWVGNFRPGIGGIDDVCWHPNRQQVLVAAGGALWCVDPDSRVGELIVGGVLGIWKLESGDLLIDDQGLAYVRLGRSGIVWHTRRISWDGFQNVCIEAGQITGEAWSPVDDRWLPFSIDLQTGRVDGGSYNGPEMFFDNRQSQHR